MTNITDKPLVSIITPVLNNIRYLEGCINNVLNQSYPNIEHIFVDGISTDGSLAVLANYKAKHPDRINFISERDNGPLEAWSKGLKIAKGKIMGYLGADDIYQPDAVRTVANFFEMNPDAYFVFGGCNYINERGEVIKRVITKDFDLKEAISNSCSIPATSVFFKREVIEKVNFDAIVEMDSELEYWIMVGKEFKIHRIDDSLSNFRLRKDKKKARGYNKELYDFAHISFVFGRRHGAGIFSPCARRYYLAVVTRPLQPILGPIFHYMSTGDDDGGNILVKITRPFHPLIAFIYHFMVGSKPSVKK